MTLGGKLEPCNVDNSYNIDKIFIFKTEITCVQNLKFVLTVHDNDFDLNL